MNTRVYARGKAKKSVAQLVTEVKLTSRTVLVRADLNTPFTKTGTPEITDDTRIREAMPTIELLAKEGAKVVLCSHLGRPKKAKTPEEKDRLRLAPVATRISELLGRPIATVSDCIGDDVKAASAALKDGELLLLENTRFYGEEEKNEPGFAKSLVADTGATVYVNDAFGAAHRAHASTAGVAAHVEHKVAGLLLTKELDFLEKAVLESPKRPLVSIVGGSKVSTKLPVLESLLAASDAVLVGGAMAFTFIKARGGQVGNSLVEDDQLELAKSLEARAKALGKKLLLPTDAVIAAKVDASAEASVVASDAIPDGMLGLDVGPATTAAWDAEVLSTAGTILWNGPMGVFEIDQFSAGTRAIADMMASRTSAGATTIVGGGDSVAAVGQFGLKKEMSHVSTGGGASLELLEGKVLPGAAALDEA